MEHEPGAQWMPPHPPEQRPKLSIAEHIDKLIAQHAVAVRQRDELLAALTEAKKDAARLDWIARHGVSIRQEPGGKQRWYLVAPFHVGVSCIDDHHRYGSARDALDAGITAVLAGSVAVAIAKAKGERG